MASADIGLIDLSFLSSDKHFSFASFGILASAIALDKDVNSKIAELDIDEQRVMEYGSIGDQLDKLYHDIDNGKLDETGEWFKAIKKVKDDNPKG